MPPLRRSTMGFTNSAMTCLPTGVSLRCLPLRRSPGIFSRLRLVYRRPNSAPFAVSEIVTHIRGVRRKAMIPRV
jgi:hypothetical protein